jgi:dTDP-4-amino-4,6-dideoxygalactose transaminase
VTIAGEYTKGLETVGDIATPVTRPDRDHRFYLYTIKTRFRDQLKSYLAERGIETRINYPYPVHLMRGYSFLGYAAGSLPVTEQLAAEILSLPLYGSLPLQHVERVIAAIKSFFNGRHPG